MIASFEVIGGGPVRTGKIVYREHAFSFDVEPAPTGGFASLQINELSLVVDENDNLLSVGGLCPRPGWQKGSVKVPDAVRGAVRVEVSPPFFPGEAVSLSAPDRLLTVYDPQSGWLVIGSPKSAKIFVTFMTGAILGLSATMGFKALWLRLPSTSDA
jgi:hypothetical protein